MQPILSFLNSSGWLHNALFAPLVLILLDFVCGVTAALKNKQFDFNKFADVFYAEAKSTDLQRYINGAVAYILASGTHLVAPDVLAWLGPAGAGVICIPVIESILKNIVELFPKQIQPEVQAVEQSIETAIAATIPTGLALSDPPLPDQFPTMVHPALVVAQQQFKMPTGVISSTPPPVQ